MYLTGGPGGIALYESRQTVAGGLNRNHELILMDQRGTLYDEPALTCPEIDHFNAGSFGPPYNAASTGVVHVAATRACRTRLASAGIDLGAYNTTENAADFADLRTALRIRQWNVHGVSYGTDLALTLMKEHPRGIRSVVLDSVVPPSYVAPSTFWGAAADGFGAIFTACARQPACAAAHPDLAGVFAKLVVKLERHPLSIKLDAAASTPVTVTFDGGRLVNWLVSVSLGNTPGLMDVPNQISALAAGNGQSIAAAFGITPPGLIGYGLQYGVACGEWVPYEPQSVLQAGRRAFPAFPDAVLAQPPQIPFISGDCHAWNVPRARTAQRAPVRSAIPTLLLSGGFDAVTPPRWAAIAAKTLTHATSVTIPAVGHFVLPESPCAQHVVASFLARPRRADARCVAGLKVPAFSPAP